MSDSSDSQNASCLLLIPDERHINGLNDDNMNEDLKIFMLDMNNLAQLYHLLILYKVIIFTVKMNNTKEVDEFDHDHYKGDNFDYFVGDDNFSK